MVQMNLPKNCLSLTVKVMNDKCVMIFWWSFIQALESLRYEKYDILLDKIGDTITQHLMMTKYFRFLRVFIGIILNGFSLIVAIPKKQRYRTEENKGKNKCEMIYKSFEYSLKKTPTAQGNSLTKWEGRVALNYLFYPSHINALPQNEYFAKK